MKHTTEITIEVQHRFEVGQLITHDSSTYEIMEVRQNPVSRGVRHTEPVYVIASKNGSGTVSTQQLTVAHVDRNYEPAPPPKEVVRCTQINTKFTSRCLTPLDKNQYLIELRDGSTFVTEQPFTPDGATFQYFVWKP